MVIIENHKFPLETYCGSIKQCFDRLCLALKQCWLQRLCYTFDDCSNSMQANFMFHALEEDSHFYKKSVFLKGGKHNGEH